VSGTSRKRYVRAAVAGIVVTMVGGLAGAPAYARRGHGGGSGSQSPSQDEDLYGCDRTFGRPPEGHLDKRTEPAGGRDVSPGQTIRVTITWDPGDWSSDQLHKVLDCVAIDGQLVTSMQGGESPTANDGHFARSYAVPDDAKDGALICDQAMLSGKSPRGDYDRQISNQVCHTVSHSPACCGGGNGCNACRAKPPCGDNGCGEKSPCVGDRCGDQPPRCGDNGCDEKPPCGDQKCGHRPPPCGGGCGDATPCGDQRSCDRDGRRGGGSSDRDRCGCDDHEGRHRGLVSKLVHELI
jgi:hypothetical protein